MGHRHGPGDRLADGQRVGAGEDARGEGGAAQPGRLFHLECGCHQGRHDRRLRDLQDRDFHLPDGRLADPGREPHAARRRGPRLARRPALGPAWPGAYSDREARGDMGRPTRDGGADRNPRLSRRPGLQGGFHPCRRRPVRTEPRADLCCLRGHRPVRVAIH